MTEVTGPILSRNYLPVHSGLAGGLIMISKDGYLSSGVFPAWKCMPLNVSKVEGTEQYRNLGLQAHDDERENGLLGNPGSQVLRIF